jgi:two-component system cell cycle response regulator
MKRIIHVDNSDFFRKQMSAFLASEGFETEGFASAKEAEMVIAGGSADIVIMGLTFADTDSESLIQRTIESFAGPIIVVSSSINKEKEEKLIAQGVRAAVSKSDSWQDNLRPHLLALKQA